MKAEAQYLGARAYARFDHPGGFASTDPNSNETVGVDRHDRLLHARRRAANAVVLDKTDPDARITFADVAALVREDADALEQYRYASGLLPSPGTVRGGDDVEGGGVVRGGEPVRDVPATDGEAESPARTTWWRRWRRRGRRRRCSVGRGRSGGGISPR